jgi:hypothetical protein
MSLVETRELRTGAEVIANARQVRARLYALKAPARAVAPPPPPKPISYISDDEYVMLMGMVKNATPALLLPHPSKPSVQSIQDAVCRHFGIPRGDFLSHRRTASVVLPRQIAMYLAKTLTLRSFPEIGRLFGGRDHTTILHAVRKIEGLVANDDKMREQIEVIRCLLDLRLG